MVALAESQCESESTIRESIELATILGDLIDANAPSTALAGVLSAIPSTLDSRELFGVAEAVRKVLGNRGHLPAVNP